MINHNPHRNKVKIIHFFNKIKIVQSKYHIRNQPHYYTPNYFPYDDEDYYNQIINNFIQAKDLVLTVLTNQMFSNLTHDMNKYDNIEIIQHLTAVIFNNETQLTHNHTNQPKRITKFHCHIIYNNLKKQKVN